MAQSHLIHQVCSFLELKTLATVTHAPLYIGFCSALLGVAFEDYYLVQNVEVCLLQLVQNVAVCSFSRITTVLLGRA